MVAAALMEGIGVQRRRGRDVATGVVLGAALGLAALFLYLGTQTSTTTGASFTILFGSMFVISPDTVPALIASGAIALAVIAVLSRVLLLTSLSPELAAARGVPVRAVGAAALFLYLGTLQTATTGASFSVLFGSIFVISPDTVPALVASGVIALAVVAGLARVLLLTSVSPDLARARGVNVRLVGVAYLAALAVTVSLSAVAIGAVLSTALLIGPAAAALRLARSPGRAMAAAAAIGTAATWIGILLAYDSYYWPPLHHGWPVSFFVVALVVIGYLLTLGRRRRRPECSPA